MEEKENNPAIKKRPSSPTVEEPCAQRARTGIPHYAYPKKFKPARHADWRNALREPCAEQIYAEDDCIRFIYDAYPKAKIHILAVPKSGALIRLNSISEVRPMHLTELKAFHQSIHDLATSLAASTGSNLRIGYHSVPSMALLHCHIISDDFESSFLKSKKHWLSFTTAFFLYPEELESLISGRKRANDIFGQALRTELQRRKAHYSDGPLACHRCRKVQPTMPALKEHIRQCNVKHREALALSNDVPVSS